MKNRRTIALVVISAALFGLALFIGPIDKTLEIYGTAFALVQGALILFNKKESWVFYCAYTLAFLVLSVYFRLYGDVIENATYIIMGIVGVVGWYGSEKVQTTTWLSAKQRGLSGVAIVCLSVAVVWFLTLTDDPLPLLDGITTAMGLVATYLMAKRKVEAWIVWFVYDILMVVIYYMIPQQPVYLMVLNVIWTLMAVGSFIHWSRDAKKDKMMTAAGGG